MERPQELTRSEPCVQCYFWPVADASCPLLRPSCEEATTSARTVKCSVPRTCAKKKRAPRRRLSWPRHVHIRPQSVSSHCGRGAAVADDGVSRL